MITRPVFETSMKSVWKVAEQFSPNQQIAGLSEHGNGNINDTFLVTVENPNHEQFILQRINTHVFKQPQLIIQNLRTYATHVDQKLNLENNGYRRWEVPHIQPTRQGQDYYIDQQGFFWRMISFVNHSRSYETVQSANHAREAGYALGRFQSLVSDLSTDKMHDTLFGFHIMPHYLQQYDRVIARGPQGGDSPEARYCHRMIAKRRDWANVLEDAKESGHLPLRTIHGDPKINNIMISDVTGLAVSVIDLDTVKPGLVHYDIGDCLRSSCNPLGEDTTNFNEVRFETDLARAILEGYLSVANKFLTENDYLYMFDTIRLMTFELGVRFFQDYLAGNLYFKVKHPEHSLERAVVQFKLTESIEAQENAIRKIIADFKPILV
jgi:Ser/Thr protein kinase RdoA (MazF antagonist)